MKKLLLLFFSVFTFAILAKGQDLTTKENYTLIYTIKLAEVTDVISAKEASMVLQELFDSNLQSFNAGTLEITIKSVFSSDQTKFTDKLLNNGYTLIYFDKKIKELKPEEK